MDTEEDKLYGIRKKVNILSKHLTEIWFFCLVLLVVCMIFDAVPYIYWATWIEKLFTYSIGNVIAIIVVIWTFTVSLSTYCLEKFGTRYYGIQMRDILFFDLGTKGILALARMVLTELIFLIFAAILESEITLVMIAFQQYLIMIYIFLFVCVKTSHRHILEQIREEIKRYTNEEMIELSKWIESPKLEKYGKSIFNSQPMLFKMVKNLNYSDFYSREALLATLKDVSKTLSNMITETEKNGDGPYGKRLVEIQYSVIVFSQQMTLDILLAGKTQEIIIDFLYAWITLEDLRIEIKQGIIAALLEEFTPQNISIWQRLIKAEKKHQRQLQIWSAVCNTYMQEHIGEEWRITYTEQQFKELYFNWEQKDMKLAMGYWKQIRKSNETYTPLFKYIF